ncbi:hypothetical protein, partial [Enterobacter asburiae]
MVFFGARDGKTSGMVVFVVRVGGGGGFGGAGRRAARNKPILVIKSGRSPAAQRLL